MRIIFMGTPEFAVPSLDMLIKNGYDVVGVVTATDKYGGRGGKKLLESAVKKYAAANGIPVLQPKNLKAPEFIEELQALKADLQIVVAFRMLPEMVWDMPRLGTYNLHGSLLPKYRGAAPINWAVIHGDEYTGATTFKITKEIDTGAILLQEKIPINFEDNAGHVHDRMMHIGAELLLKSVQKIEEGEIKLQQQDESLVSKAPKLNKGNTEIDFNQDAKSVYNFIRGLSPYPGAWTTLDGALLKIYKAELIEENASVGKISTDQKKFFHIACGTGSVKVVEMQMQGRKRMDVKSFLNGYTIENDAITTTLK